MSGFDDDQGSMQAFIRSQMYSIMHPVAEHVREVQAQVQQLAKRVKETDGKIDEHRVCFEQHLDELTALRRTIASTDQNVEKLQNDLGVAHREKERLGADHEVTKTDLAKTAGDLRMTNVLLKQMQQKHEDLDGDVRSLHTGHEKTNRTFAQEVERISQVMEIAHGLNGRTMDMMQSIDDLVRSTAENNRGLQKLAQHHEKTHGALGADLESKQEQLDSIESRLGSTQQDAQSHCEKIRDIEERLRLLKSSLLSVDGEKDSTNGSSRFDREGPETALKVNADLDGVKATLNKLQEVFSTYKDDHSQLLKDLDRRVADNTTRVEGLHVAKESMSEHLKRNDGLLSKLQRNLDALGGQVDMLQQDMKGVQGGHADLAGKVDSQRIALSKTQADLKHTGGIVDSTTENVLHLKGGLAAMDATLSKLGSRYDNCTRNIHGVSRGLADVGKHVAQGDHGMLAPRSPLRNRLPGLVLGSPGSLETTIQSARG